MFFDFKYIPISATAKLYCVFYYVGMYNFNDDMICGKLFVHPISCFLGVPLA